jgi:hypothetical protein
MRGAPQLGFSRHILRIRSRTSHEMSGRPGLPRVSGELIRWLVKRSDPRNALPLP